MLFEGVDIGAKSIVCGRGIEAVGPEALVEDAEQEEGLVVEKMRRWPAESGRDSTVRIAK